MSKLLKLYLVLAGAVCTAQAGQETSHTFFSVIPNFQSASPERVALYRNDRLEKAENGIHGCFQIVPFGGSTSNSGSSKLSNFFLPAGCRTCTLTTKEYNLADQTPNYDLRTDAETDKNLEARHFNIQTVNGTFESEMQIIPNQSVFGLGLTYTQRLSDSCNGKTGWWLEVSMPIERVQNNVQLIEKVINDGGGAVQELGLDDSPRVANMTQAFRQSTWLYGKIDNQCHTQWGVADIELKVGFNLLYCPKRLSCDTCNWTSYVGLVIPTGNTPQGKFLFEPIVGNNHHFGVMIGATMAGFDVYAWEKTLISAYFDVNSRYLFNNQEVRSFDLQGRPWGRYMETYATLSQASQAAQVDSPTSGTSGINLFTRCVNVFPRASVRLNTAFVLIHDCNCWSFVAEGGYNVFARQAEIVTLKNTDNCNTNKSTNCYAAADNSVDTGIGIKSVSGVGKTSQARNIRQAFIQAEYGWNGDPGYQSLKTCDFDLESAAHPGTFVNAIYGTLGVEVGECNPTLIGIGGSYEFTPSCLNEALNRWLVWGKLAVSF